ncbi:MAG TPA: hypothetical protein VFI68_15190, partial [Anaerolineales bacterium]|nr:hypothetical protein [Anaerolineales bacterium]
MKKAWSSITVLIWIFTACAPQAATDRPPIITEKPTLTQLPVDLTPSQLAAIAALSESLGMPSD